MQNFSVNDFFCGAGGMGLGFKQAGFRLAGAWDFDKWAVESYGNNVSPKVKQEDITQLTWKDIPYADVWAYGFPCQDLSVAGKKAGMIKGKTRSGLFYEVMRLLDEVKEKNPDFLPKIILAENVKGVRKYLPTIKEEYKARGYKAYYTLYNSKYWGVPQNRERYFILGVHHSIDKEFYFRGQQTEYVPNLYSVLETEVDEKYFYSDTVAKDVIEEIQKQADLCEILNYFNSEFKVTTEPHLKQIGLLNMKGHDILKRVYDPKGVCPTLTAMQGGNTHPKIIIPYTSINEGNRWRVRKLTPRECFRVQGFPDSYKILVSDTQAYKQAGNAVTVPVARGIAEDIIKFLKSI